MLPVILCFSGSEKSHESSANPGGLRERSVDRGRVPSSRAQRGAEVSVFVNSNSATWGGRSRRVSALASGLIPGDPERLCRPFCSLRPRRRSECWSSTPDASLIASFFVFRSFSYFRIIKTPMVYNINGEKTAGW